MNKVVDMPKRKPREIHAMDALGTKLREISLDFLLGISNTLTTLTTASNEAADGGSLHRSKENEHDCPDGWSCFFLYLLAPQRGDRP